MIPGKVIHHRVAMLVDKAADTSLRFLSRLIEG